MTGGRMTGSRGEGTVSYLDWGGLAKGRTSLYRSLQPPGNVQLPRHKTLKKRSPVGDSLSTLRSPNWKETVTRTEGQSKDTKPRGRVTAAHS